MFLGSYASAPAKGKENSPIRTMHDNIHLAVNDDCEDVSEESSTEQEVDDNGA